MRVSGLFFCSGEGGHGKNQIFRGYRIPCAETQDREQKNLVKMTRPGGGDGGIRAPVSSPAKGMFLFAMLMGKNITRLWFVLAHATQSLTRYRLPFPWKG